MVGEVAIEIFVLCVAGAVISARVHHVLLLILLLVARLVRVGSLDGRMADFCKVAYSLRLLFWSLNTSLSAASLPRLIASETWSQICLHDPAFHLKFCY